MTPPALQIFFLRVVDYLIAIYFYFIRDQPLLLFISSSSLLFASLLNLLAREGFFSFFFLIIQNKNLLSPLLLSLSLSVVELYM